MKHYRFSLLVSILMSASVTTYADGSTSTGSVTSTPALTGTYVVVSNYAAATLTKCSVNTSTGALSSCAIETPTITVSGITTSLLNKPAGSIFNPATSTLYVTNQGGNSVTTCTYSKSKTVCSNYVDSTFSAPSAAALSADGQTLFVTNGTPGNEMVSICTVDPQTGTITNDSDNPCTRSVSTGAPYLSGIALFGTTSMYVSSDGGDNASTIGQCTISEGSSGDVEVNSCAAPSIIGLEQPSSLALSADNLWLYAGNANTGNGVTTCSVSSTGVLNNCTIFNDASFNEPGYIALNYLSGSSTPTSGYLYVANFGETNGSSNVSICPVTDDVLGACTYVGGFQNANGISVLTPAAST